MKEQEKTLNKQSTMHCLMKFEIREQCVEDTSKEILEIIAKMVEEYKTLEEGKEKKALWRKIVASLPCGFCLGATMTTNYQQLKNKGALNYLGTPMHGLVNDFNITNTGLLAASHREGSGAVNNYLNNLVKNRNGQYYINYDEITDNRLSEMFKRIETRLRNFEK